MKENQRKCMKCGSSPAEDPQVKLFRFPRPGIKNTLRCELWAKYSFPNEECTTALQAKLYAEHRMLCDRHFKISSYIDYATKKLHRFAVPEDESERTIIHVPPVAEAIAGPSRLALSDITKDSNLTPEASVKGKMCSGSSHKKVTEGILTCDPVVPKTLCKNRILYNKCRKQMKQICQLRNRIHRLNNKIVLKSLIDDEASKALTKKITPTLALMLQGEIKNYKRKSKGHRWTKEQKITALRLYKRSPTCYRLLRRLFCLPAPSTLKTLLRHFLLCVGINKRIFEILKKFINIEETQYNEFILMFDEMSLRKHLQYNNVEDKIEGYQDHANQGRSMQVASHALVFMICGIRKKVKQPVAYYFSGSSVTADRLAVLIKEVLHHCFEAKINVTATVCDMDGVNRRALGILGATSQNPNIQVDNHVITTMFDPPHLLKCFRNLFLKYNIRHLTNITSGDKTGKGIAKWSHIQEFYEIDNVNPNFVFAPCLKREHLAPNAKQKMRVKLAAQVLSHSVAAGMYAKISQGELTAEATVTANLLANMDKLFDGLNSNTADLRRGKPFATNLTAKTLHLSFFQEMKMFFQTLEFIGCKKMPPSVEGWVWTLNAVNMYWNRLTSRQPTIRSLSTRRLQQDPIENLFGCIRGHCGSNTNPTTSQFVAGLKTTILSNISSVGTKGNCELDDNDAILDNFKMLLQQTQDAVGETLSEKTFNINLEESILDTFEDSIGEVNGEIQACAYVCGFMLKGYKNDCVNCRESLLAKDIEIHHNFVNLKEYSEFKKSLIYASKDFITCVEYCATTINTYLESHSYIKELKKYIISNLIKKVNFEFLNKCSNSMHKEDNVKYITNSTFYICIKRFCILKNRKFSDEASATALRNKINILKHV